jgi:hypothetical protein
MNYSPDTLNTKIAIPPQRAHAFIYPLDRRRRRLLQFAFICRRARNQRRRPRVPRGGNYSALMGQRLEKSDALFSGQSSALVIGTIVSVCKFTVPIRRPNAKSVPRICSRPASLVIALSPVIKLQFQSTARCCVSCVRIVDRSIEEDISKQTRITGTVTLSTLLFILVNTNMKLYSTSNFKTKASII